MSLLNISNVRGMLLEEAILHLLRRSGYKVIEEVHGDPTLSRSAAGIEVHGRGTSHQIDAIADYLISQPFSHPQRLLVEGKCYLSTTLGIEVVRNAVGVVKDLNEFWVPSPGAVVGRQRFHYQSAIVSATSFSVPAQHYAFAHDIFLLPVEKSAFLKGIVAAIRALRAEAPGRFSAIRLPEDVTLTTLRKKVRRRISGRNNSTEFFYEVESNDALEKYFEECDRLGAGLVGMVAGRFPILFAPASPNVVSQLNYREPVRIFWDHRSWYLRRRDGEPLFSFDLPTELFQLYAEAGTLSRSAALDLKMQTMSVIQAVIADNDTVRMINFELDQEWIVRLQEELRRRGNPRHPPEGR